MRTMASVRWGMILLIFVAAGLGQVFAASCDQPSVSFQAGKLAIISKGCSLQQVLTAVSRETGIETVVPASAGAVPVFAAIGPADPVRVVTELLDGSPFNSTLVAKADGTGGLLRVVLTERKAPIADKPTVAATQPGAAATAPSGGKQAVASAPSANRPDPNQDKKNKDEKTAAAQPGNDLQAEARGRPEIDESTLRKLPPLPPGVPTAMWSLYPDIVQNNGIVPSGPPLLPNGQPAPSATAFNGATFDPLRAPLYPFDPAYAPKGVIGLPQLPPGIDPAIGRIYPWNLMQLIQNPITLPNIKLPPMAKPLYR
jgi:hypothetical protein